MKTILTRFSSRFIATSHALLKEIQYLELSVVKSLHDQTLRRNEKSTHFLELVSSPCFERGELASFTTHEERYYLRSKGIRSVVQSCYYCLFRWTSSRML
jgi:hypothetical protein